MRIAICDDDIKDLESVRLVVQEFAMYKLPKHPITIDTFRNGFELLAHIETQGNYDLIILDILMPGMNGIEVASVIRRVDENSKIVFLSTSSEFAVSSYKVGAYFYLVKPVANSDLTALLNKVLNQMIKEQQHSLVIKEKSRITRVLISNIDYIESIKHNIVFHLHDQSKVISYGTLNNYLSILLADSSFVHCHRSFVVNMNSVVSITTRDFVMADQTLVPISKILYSKSKSAYISHVVSKGGGVL